MDVSALDAEISVEEADTKEAKELQKLLERCTQLEKEKDPKTGCNAKFQALASRWLSGQLLMHLR